ncbi:beta/alpha barrel domain-containing protein [Corynebacterium gerontici]|uniref:Deoxyribose-phosphate aldolase n=1 Tax=Corynebacterium gerontici TaxID=2079234 RepID=A0A3G6J733_9CORY|nr:aminotransferase [Corynebacterium gerontici]AZA12250.1 Deoxyribose-phosphate aldolase [Corynebacterium gerontici]
MAVELPISSLLINPAATFDEIREQSADALRQAMGVVVEPSMLTAIAPHPDAADIPDTPTIATFAGFPTGKHHSLIKATEARFAVQQGATIVALVPDVAHVQQRQSTALITEVATCRESIPRPAQLAVVLETTVLDPATLQWAVRQLQPVGVDAFIAGTTGSSPEGIHALTSASSVPVIGVGGHESAPALVEAGAGALWAIF